MSKYNTSMVIITLIIIITIIIIIIITTSTRTHVYKSITRYKHSHFHTQWIKSNTNQAQPKFGSTLAKKALSVCTLSMSEMFIGAAI